MPTINCGDECWPNLDTVVRDAARYRQLKNEVRMLRMCLWLILKKVGPVAITDVELKTISPNDPQKAILESRDFVNNATILAAQDNT